MNTTQINPISGTVYRNTNALHLAEVQEEQAYSTNEWGTFLQWRDKGYRVKKGSKGVKIQKIVEFTDEHGKDQKRPRFYAVFNRDQVEPVAQMVNSEAIKVR